MDMFGGIGMRIAI